MMKRVLFSFYLIVSVFLTGCGGESLSGTDNPVDPGTPETPETTITLTISDTTVSEGNPVTITATVTEEGQLLSGTVVTFSTDPTLGNFTPETGTVLTEDGVASIVLNAGEAAGAAEVTATISSGESAKIAFQTIQAPEAVLSMGSGDPFEEGTIDVSLPEISAGGTTVISVKVVDENGDLYTNPLEINFSSICSKEATPTALIDSPVITSSGEASSTYLAQGCVGDDPISVNTVVGGVSLSASGSVSVLSAEIGSIEHFSTEHTLIAVKGAGSAERPESSEVIFLVKDANGNPVSNQEVQFTATGGADATPASATTNASGLVKTVVNSGTKVGAISVVATIADSDPLITTQSGDLLVSTYIPDQDSISLSANILNPEAWNTEGTEVEITARLADASNNPPRPTIVYFTTEGGSIDSLDSSCTTGADGSCTVIWRSQNPRPEGHVLGDINNLNHLPETINTMGQKYGGRVTILATTIGEESFPDLNGNGRFDKCEWPAFIGGTGRPCMADGSENPNLPEITYSGNDVSGQPYDLNEAFLDHNEDGFFNPGEEEAGEQAGGDLEELVDLNADGLFTKADGKYNGILCAIPVAGESKNEGCSDEQSIHVRGSLVLVMSGSNPYFNTVLPADVDGDGRADSAIEIAGEGTASASVIISDLHNQPMPEGTIIEYESTVGSIESGDITTWPNDNHNGGSQFSVVIKGESEPKTGLLLLKVTTPGGLETTYNVATINITTP